MKQLFPLSFLAIGALVLAGCGGKPASLTSNAKVGTPSPSDPPATASGSNSGGGTTSSGNTSSSAPAPAPQAQSSSALPTPPANATVLDQIQRTTDSWSSCSICAQGTNDTDNYWMAQNQSSPSMTGNSSQFYIGGPPWSNALFSKTYHDYGDTTHFLWEFYIYWDGTTMANIWTAEADFWQSVGGQEFMIGSQCNFGDGYWDIWDSKNKQWLHSGVTCGRMAAGQWHHIQWYMERLGTSQYRYNTLVVDGQAYPINRTFSPNPTNWPDTMGIQWQVDQSSSGVDLHEWVDNVKLTVW